MKVRCAIIGSGNIGTDLMFKVLRSPLLELALVAGIDPESRGLALAREHGIATSIEGVAAVVRDPSIQIVWDATSARVHRKINAPALRESGKIAIDLTPAAVGPYVVPAVNMAERLTETNVNLVTCGGQATVPIVHAVGRITPVEYAEIVSTVASRSAGPGTRQNIDEFTRTTADSLVRVGGAKRGKAIIILNPADPPLLMRNTIHCQVGEDVDFPTVKRSIEDMVRVIQGYVPGYRLRVPPFQDGDRVTTIIEVEGAGDFLPKYSGNLDIMTAAAVAVGERYAKHLIEEGNVLE